jgi:hypothetical protein
MNFFKRYLPASSLALLTSMALLIPAALCAQNTGTLKGQVTDQSGAAVPNASVTLTGPNNAVKVAQTDSGGNYSVTGLAAGQYTVRVMAPGFTLFEKTAMDLDTGRATTLDVPLAIAVEKQEVTVADTQQIAIDPDKNAGALVLKGEDIDALPDDPDDLQADLLALAGPAAGPNGGQIFVDGFSNGQLPPKDSIREIRINSNPFSAEYDQSGYGRVEIFTKAGTDKTHGMVQLNYGDSIWNARNPYSTNEPYYTTQNLNANLSGSILKKISLFLDFERRANQNSNAVNAQQYLVGGQALSPSNISQITATNLSTYQLQESVIAPNMLYRVSPRISWAVTPNFTLDARYNYNNTSSSNNGIGGTFLTDTAYGTQLNNQNIALTGTWIVNPATINESRFQLQHNYTTNTGDNPVVNISVGDAFTTGSNYPLTYTHNNNLEYQNYTSITHKAHFIKFGARLREYLQDSYTTNNFPGQFTWQSLGAYTNFLQGIAAGQTLPQIVAAGYGPQQYTQAAQLSGSPLLGVNQFDAGLFIQDDWRILPNLTLSPGLRYEIQNNIGDKADFAPRMGLAWGLGGGKGRNKTPNTVLRLGYGWFYTRFPLADTVNDQRFNGLNQLSYTVNNPSFLTAAALQQIGYSATVANQLCAAASGACAPTLGPQQGIIPSYLTPYEAASTTYHTDGDLRSPRIMQTAVGVDRSLPRNMTLSVNFIDSRGVHELQTVDINTPIPGTYIPSTSPTGTAQGNYPYGQNAGVYNLYESGGIFKQNQLIFNMRVPFNKFSLQGYYAYGHASADSAVPSNPYNFAEDWGRAPYDIRHRIQIEGTVMLPWKLRLNPNISFQSAPPFNIVEGIDQYGTTSTQSARPAFAPAGSTAPVCTQALAGAGTTCQVDTLSYGNFLINPPAGTPLIPINDGIAHSQFTVNARLSRTWGFGERLTSSNNNRNQQGQNGQNNQPGFGRGASGNGGGGGGGGGGRGGGGGNFGGGGRGGGGDSSGQKYTLTAGIVGRNIFNTVNPAGYEGDLLSNRFGESESLANIGGQNVSANRRLEFNLRFSF